MSREAIHPENTSEIGMKRMNTDKVKQFLAPLFCPQNTHLRLLLYGTSADTREDYHLPDLIILPLSMSKLFLVSLCWFSTSSIYLSLIPLLTDLLSVS